MSDDILGIDHLGLTVGNLDASLGFFTRCLGWEEFGGNADYPSAYVTNGYTKLTLWQQVEPGAGFDRKANIGLHHLALKILDESALWKVFDKIKDWPGVAVEFAPELSGQGPKKHFMILEPGGTRLEFSHDPR